MLFKLKETEEKMGRVPSIQRNAPRPIDLDILLFNDEKILLSTLVVPHPQMQEREFVIGPLMEFVETLPVVLFTFL